MDKFTKFIVIDTETCGIREDSVILSFSACFIDIEKYEVSEAKYQDYINSEIPHKDTFNRFLNRRDQIENLNSIEYESTMEFWRDQYKNHPENSEMIKNLFSSKNRTLAKNTIIEFTEWFNSFGESSEILVFERGNGFDSNKIARAAELTGNPIPWVYYNVKETRTWIDSRIKQEDKPKIYYKNSLNFKKKVDESLGIIGMVKHNSLHDCTADAFRIAFIIDCGHKL